MIKIKLYNRAFFYKFVLVKNLFKYLLNSSLAILVYLLSVGVSYSTIICPKKNNQKNCCNLEQITCCSVEISHNCCYEEILEIKFEFDVPIEKKQESPNFFIAFTQPLYQLVAGLKKIQKLAWSQDLPPPKKLSQRLSILQVYHLWF